MSISFSGLASGLDTSSWIESLVALKRAKVTTLTEQKEVLALSKDTLASIRSFFSSFRATIEKITDTKRFFNPTTDLFSQNLAISSRLEVLTATATHEAEEATYEVLVDKLATNTSATSNYNYTTTIVETTVATENSKLTDLGVNIQSGGSCINVDVDGVQRSIILKRDDTIATFINKLQKIGVSANYNEKTGIFSINIDDGDIIDTDNTGIVDRLHLEGVNEGYLSNTLTAERTETVYSIAKLNTKLSELNVKTGTVTFNDNGSEILVDVDPEKTIEQFIQQLKNDHTITANLDGTGVFTIIGAEIVDDGDTDLIDAFGLSVDIYSQTQVSNGLKYTTTTTTNTGATLGTFLKDLEGGETLIQRDESTWRTSNGDIVTITVETDTTIEGYFELLKDAGINATLNPDSTIAITGGYLVEKGDYFDPETVFNLTTEITSSMTTARPLTELVTSSSNISEETDLSEFGLTDGTAVFDVGGELRTVDVTSTMSIQELIDALDDEGIYANYDKSSSKLTIENAVVQDTSSSNIIDALGLTTSIETKYVSSDSLYSTSTAYVSATDSTKLVDLGVTSGEVVTLMIDGTESGTFTVDENTSFASLDTWAKGIDSNIEISVENGVMNVKGAQIKNDSIEALFGIEDVVINSYALGSFITVTTEATATVDSSLGSIIAGLNAESVVETEGYTLRINGKDYNYFDEKSSLNEFMQVVEMAGGKAQIVSGRLYVTDCKIEGTIAEAFGIESEVVTIGISNSLGNNLSIEKEVIAKESSYVKDFGCSGTFNIIGTDGSTIATASTSNNPDLKFEDLLELMNNNGLTATMSNGIISVSSDSGNSLSGSLADALGLISSGSGTIDGSALISSSSGNVLYNILYTATANTTLGEIGIANPENGITVMQNGTELGTLTLSSGTQLWEIMSQLQEDYGFTNCSITPEGTMVLNAPENTYITGHVAEALGFGVDENTTTTTEGISTTGGPIMYSATVTATGSTTLDDLEIDTSAGGITVMNSGTVQGTLTISPTTSLDEIIRQLEKDYGFTNCSVAANGTLVLNAPENTYITGPVAEALGFDYEVTGTNTTTSPLSATSTAAIVYTQTTTATGTTTLGELGINPPTEHTEFINSVTHDHSNSEGLTEVRTASELANAIINNDDIILMNDIDLEGHDWSTVLSGNTEYCGIIDGNGYAIKNLTINSNSDNVGFLGKASSTTIRDLGLEDVDITGANYVGGIVGYAYGYVTIENCYVTGSVKSSGSNVGMIAGKLICSAINAAYTAGGVEGSSDVGGIAGDVSNASLINNVVSATNVKSTVGSAGGLVSWVDNSTIQNSTTYGYVYRHGGTGAAIGYLNNSTASNINWCSETNSRASGIFDWQDSTKSGIVEYNSLLEIMELNNADANVFSIMSSEEGYLGKISVSSSTTLDEIITQLNGFGITGSVDSDGSITLNMPDGVYLLGSVPEALGYSMSESTTSGTITTGASQTVILLRVRYTVSAAATGTTTLGTLNIDTTSGGITVMSSSTGQLGTLTLSSTTTLDNIIDQLEDYGFTGSVDANGTMILNNPEGVYLTGSVAEALGFGVSSNGSVITTNVIDTTITSSEVITYTKTETATGTSTLEEIDISPTGGITVMSSSTGQLGTLTISGTTSLNDIIDQLEDYGFTGSVDANGTLVLNNPDGVYITGAVAEALGFSTTTDEIEISTTVTSTTYSAKSCASSSALTYANTVSMTEISVRNLGSVNSGTVLLPFLGAINSCDTSGFTTVSTEAQLTEALANNESIVLTSDITITSDWTCVEGYSGTIEGNGHTIDMDGVSFENALNGENYGFIGSTDVATIRNLGIKNLSLDVTSNTPIGGLVGYASDTTIENCFVQGTVQQSGDYGSVGLLVGHADYSNITNCYTTGNVDVVGNPSSSGGLTEKDFSMGGLIGYAGLAVTISNSHTNASITSIDYDNYNVGGLVGYIDAGGSISNCFIDSYIAGGYNTGYVIGASSGNNVTLSNVQYGTTKYSEAADASGDGTIYEGYMEQSHQYLLLPVSYTYTAVQSATSSTTLGQLGLNGSATITVGNTTTTSSATITVNSDTTLNSLISSLSSKGVTASLTSGTLSLTTSGENYVSGMSSSLEDVLKLDIGSGSSYTSSETITTTTTTDTITVNTASTIQHTAVATKTLSGDTTLGDLGITSTQTVCIGGPTADDDTTMYFNSNTTLNELIDEFDLPLTSIENGLFTYEYANDGYYLQSMSPDLANALKIQVGNGYTYETENYTDYEMTSSNIAHTVPTSQTLDYNTTLDKFGINSNQVITVANEGGSNIYITVDGSDTFGDLLDKLQTEGHLSITTTATTATIAGNETNYITAMDSALSNVLRFNVGNGWTYKTDSYAVFENSYDNRGFTNTATITATESTTFGELGLTTDQEITVHCDGFGPWTYTVTKDTRIDEFCQALNNPAVGMVAGISNNGVINISPNTTTNYIESIDPILADILNIEAGEGKTYVTEGDVEYNMTSDNRVLSSTQLVTATADTTLEDLGIDSEQVIYYMDNGETLRSIVVDKTISLDELASELYFAGLGQCEYREDTGEFYIDGDYNDTYVTSISPELAAVLGIEAGENLTYEVNSETTYEMTTENKVLGRYTSIPAEDTTTLGEIGVNSQQVITIRNEAEDKNVYVTVDQDTTYSEMYSAIEEATNGNIDVSRLINGGMKFVGNDDYYITAMDSELANALKLQVGEGYSYTILSSGGEVTISDSNLQRYETITTITTLSTVNTLEDSEGNKLVFDGEGNTSIVVNTTSTDGVETTVTITVASSDTIANVISKFNDIGINASLENGQFVVSSTVLSDFTATGDLADILFGDEFTLNYETVIENSASDVLIQESSDSMNTDSKLVDIGVTNGDITITKDGNTSTINIDTSSIETVQDFLDILEDNGFNTKIKNGRITLNANGNITLNSVVDGSNILEKLGLTTYEQEIIQQSDKLTETILSTNTIEGSEKLCDLTDSAGNNLGITSGDVYVYQDGTRKTFTIDENESLDSLATRLGVVGIEMKIVNGKISLKGDGNSYITTDGIATGASNILEKINATDWISTGDTTSKVLQSSESIAVTADTKLKDIVEAGDLAEGAFVDGYITAVINGSAKDIYVSGNQTIGDFMEELNFYGFKTYLNSAGKLIIKGDGDCYIREYEDPAQASNIIDLFDIDEWNHETIATGSVSSDSSITTQELSADRKTKLADLGVTSGEYYIYNKGVKFTAYIGNETTVGDLMDTLGDFNIQSVLTSSDAGTVLTLVGEGNSYIEASESVGASNILNLFNPPNPTTELIYTGAKQVESDVTVTVPIEPTTELSKFDNGVLVAEGDLSITLNGETSVIKISPKETFGTLIDKLVAIGVNASLENGQVMIQSGYDSFTINTDGTTSSLAATIGLVYIDDMGGFVASTDTVMATTTTVEERTASVSHFASGNTKLSTLNITDGTLTLYKNGEKATIQIVSDETFDQLNTRISDAFGNVAIKFEEGYLKIYSTDGTAKIDSGATTDSSNFSTITGIQANEDGEVVSARQLYCVNSDSVITKSGLFKRGDVREGSFIVGDATIVINDQTTINDIIAQINGTEETKATAYWDNIGGKLIIQSRISGASFINIEAIDTNFTDIMGFTQSEWNPDDTLAVNKLNIDAQELGQNAKFSINGTNYTSTSNTVDSAVTKIKGLTINLKGLTEGTPVILTVEKDKETLANAVEDVVNAYNELMLNVDKAIAKDGQLHSETTLRMIRNQIRNAMTSTDIGTTIFRNLDAVGISTETADANNLSTDNDTIVNLTFDRDKFYKAFTADSNALKDLLVGGENNTGVFMKIENTLEDALKGVSGYFDSATNSYTDRIGRLNDKITKQNEMIEKYKVRLENKFASMDLLISQIQQQYSSFLGV